MPGMQVYVVVSQSHKPKRTGVVGSFENTHREGTSEAPHLRAAFGVEAIAPMRPVPWTRETVEARFHWRSSNIRMIVRGTFWMTA